MAHELILVRSPHLSSCQRPRLGRKQMYLDTRNKQWCLHQQQQRCLRLAMEHHRT